MGLNDNAVITPKTLEMLIVAVECYDIIHEISDDKNDVLQELYRMKKQISIV